MITSVSFWMLKEPASPLLFPLLSPVASEWDEDKLFRNLGIL